MRTVFCKHFTGMAGHTHCRAGVEYDAVIAGKGTLQCTLPCVIQALRPPRLPCHCDQCDMPTEEELAAEELEANRSAENIKKARQAIVAHLGGPWKRGMPDAKGAIDCPACGQYQSLRFTRSSYNGHVHCKCTTQGCVAWLE